MNPLKKKLQTCQMRIKAQKNYLAWQKVQLKSSVKQKATSPFTLASLGLLTLFLISFYPKVAPAVDKLAKKRSFSFLWFLGRVYLIKSLPLLKLLTQFKQPHRIKKYVFSFLRKNTPEYRKSNLR